MVPITIAVEDTENSRNGHAHVGEWPQLFSK